MSKIFVSNWISLDGIFSGPNGETDWFTNDKELENYNLGKLEQSDGIIFGRSTYELMESFWPTEAANAENPAVINFMNNTPKHTFSKTMTSSGWRNSFFYTEISREVVEAIKSKSGKDIVILGSGAVSMQLHQLGLIDEYKIMLDPQLLGEGKLFFQNIDKTSLELMQVKTFPCGVNYLEYQVRK